MTAPVGRDAFGDPATGTVVAWDQNHSDEQGAARIRTIMNLQPSISRWQVVRAIRQQAARSELVLKLAGNAPTLRQHEMFLHHMVLSLTQSIYFFHAAGEKYECFLTDYEPLRKYAIRTAKGEKYTWTYTLQLDVLSLLT
jgi:hypothetical protein